MSKKNHTARFFNFILTTYKWTAMIIGTLFIITYILDVLNILDGPDPYSSVERKFIGQCEDLNGKEFDLCTFLSLNAWCEVSSGKGGFIKEKCSKKHYEEILTIHSECKDFYNEKSDGSEYIACWKEILARGNVSTKYFGSFQVSNVSHGPDSISGWQCWISEIEPVIKANSYYED